MANPPGRPPKINPARLAKYLGLVSSGNYLKTAAEASGVSDETVRLWRVKGETMLDAIRTSNPRIDDEIADWLLVFPDDFAEDNPMWDAPQPSGIDADEWTYILFFLCEKKARAMAEAALLKRITKAAKTSWQAAAWALERTRGERFKANAKLEHTGPDDGPIQLEHISPDALMERIAGIREREKKNDE